MQTPTIAATDPTTAFKVIVSLLALEIINPKSVAVDIIV